MKDMSLYSLVSEFERILPKIPCTGSISANLRSMAKNGDLWKSALLATECADALTGGKLRAVKYVRAAMTAVTIAEIIQKNVSDGISGPMNEWKMVSRLSGIPVPKKVTVVPAGPIPPRVIAHAIRNCADGHLHFPGYDRGCFDVILRYTTIVDCIPHGSTYEVTLKPGTDKPIVVIESRGKHFVLIVPTINVNRKMLLDVATDMLCADDTDCSHMDDVISCAVISTFDTKKYAFYPSDGIASMRDNYRRSEISTEIVPEWFDSMVKSMRNVLELGMGRGYAFYGPAGVGKTMLVKQIAWKLNDCPLIILPAAKILAEKYSLDELASYILKMMAIHRKVIFVVDDLDGCEIVDKNLAATQLISFLDRLKECADYTGSAYLFLSTVNDPGKITDVIINRSGRIDELVEIPNLCDWQIRQLAHHYGYDLDCDAVETMCNHKFSASDVRNACDMVSIMDASGDAESKFTVAISRISSMKQIR